LAHSRALTKVAYAAPETDARRFASVQNLTRHPHTLWPHRGQQPQEEA
jgi:hypothetical protein